MATRSSQKPKRQRAPSSVAIEQRDLFREIAKRIPDMSSEELASLLTDLKPLRTEGATEAEQEAQKLVAQQKIKAPTSDDELHALILELTGYNIPRVAVCHDHCSPFDPISDAYFNRENAILVMASRESGKCLTASSLIYDVETGDRVRIEDVVAGRLDRALTMTPDGRVVSAPITFRWATGTKRCLRVTTLSGRRVEVTPEHPFMTTRGWTRCDDLEDGESIALPASIPMPSAPTRIPDGHLELLAVSLAERSTHKRIPEVVFRLDQEQLSRFLSIFWMCDGYIADRYADIALGSQEMAEQVQHLLLRFGVQSRVAYKQATCDGQVFDAWRLCIYGNCIEKFGSAVNLWGEKRRRLEALIAKDRCPSAGRPVLTAELMDDLRRRFPQRSRNTGQQRSREAYEMLDWRPHRGFGVSILTRGKVINLQARRLRALCHAHSASEDEFSLLLSDEIWWDPIISVEEIGDQEVYDLTMSPTECFVADDVIVHNTLTVSVLHFINAETKPGCEGITFGAIKPQAQRAYQYVKDFVFRRDENGNRIPKPQILGDPTRERTEWKSGSSIALIVGTRSGVNSPHPQVVHADELDLMEEEVFNESRSMSSSKTLPGGKRIPALDIITSTRKSTRGLMQKLIDETDEAKAAGHKPPWKIYSFCFKESSAEVPCCRVVDPIERVRRLLALGRSPNELCSCDTTVKGEWGPGQPRTLESVCRGDLFKSRGWMHYDDVARKFMQNSQAMWEAQMECRRPIADGLYLPTFSRNRHCVRGWIPRPQHGQISMGVDWGGSAKSASVVLWVQGPLLHPVEVVGFSMRPLTIPQGSYVVFDQIHISIAGATKLADMVVAKEIDYRQRYPGWRVRGRFADMAGAQQRTDWHEHSPPLRTQWYITRDFDPSVETVQGLMSDNLLYLDVVTCAELADDLESWRMAKGREVHDESSHGPAALRYDLGNVVVIERRRESEQGKREQLPAVRERGVDAVDRAGLLGAVGSPGQGIETEAWRRSFGHHAGNAGSDGWKLG
jgi:hypothetical protein